MDLFELIEARALIAVESAGIAAPIISSQSILELEKIEAKMFAKEKTDVSPAKLGEIFYNTVAHATRNHVIILITESLWKIQTGVSRVEDICRQKQWEILEDYTKIIEAFRNKDALTARKSMQSHFKRMMDELLLASEQEAYKKMKSEVSETRSRFLLCAQLS